jgi:hypothetical protein
VGQEHDDYDDRPGRRRARPLLLVAVLLLIVLFCVPLIAFTLFVVWIILSGALAD